MLSILKLPQETLYEIAARAKRLRKSKKLSQEELALKSGVSFGSIKRFERTGKISLESLVKVAVILDALSAFDRLFEPQEMLPTTLDDVLNRKS